MIHTFHGLVSGVGFIFLREINYPVLLHHDSTLGGSWGSTYVAMTRYLFQYRRLRPTSPSIFNDEGWDIFDHSNACTEGIPITFNTLILGGGCL